MCPAIVGPYGYVLTPQPAHLESGLENPGHGYAMAVRWCLLAPLSAERAAAGTGGPLRGDPQCDRWLAREMEHERITLRLDVAPQGLQVDADRIQIANSRRAA